MAAAGSFGAPLQNVINAYVYGDAWERTGLTAAERSLVMLAITAASNRPAEFRVHGKGALAQWLHARAGAGPAAACYDVLWHSSRDRAQSDRSGVFWQGVHIGGDA
jgi:hypothetical protein